MHKDLFQPVSSPSAQMQQRVSGWCLSTSFLHLPGKAERTSPALFSPGESENYSPQLWARQSEFLSAWREWAEKGTLDCFAPASVAMPWSRNPCPEPQSRFPAAAAGTHGGVGASPSAPGITVSFPVLAAKGMGNTSAYRTLLGHNSLHDLIILIGINWENNSLFQQE